MTRRSFYTIFTNLLGAAIAAVVAIPAAGYLLLKPKSGRVDDLIELTDVGALRTAEPREAVYFRTRLDGWRRVREKTTAWVVKSPSGKVTAFSPQCTHLGCAYHWEAESKTFACPCHSSAFGLDGEVIDGPAPRPLDRYVSRVERGKLLISSEIQKS